MHNQKNTIPIQMHESGYIRLWSYFSLSVSLVVLKMYEWFQISAFFKTRNLHMSAKKLKTKRDFFNNTTLSLTIQPDLQKNASIVEH